MRAFRPKGTQHPRRPLGPRFRPFLQCSLPLAWSKSLKLAALQSPSVKWGHTCPLHEAAEFLRPVNVPERLWWEVGEGKLCAKVSRSYNMAETRRGERGLSSQQHGTGIFKGPEDSGRLELLDRKEGRTERREGREKEERKEREKKGERREGGRERRRKRKTETTHLIEGIRLESHFHLDEAMGARGKVWSPLRASCAIPYVVRQRETSVLFLGAHGTKACKARRGAGILRPDEWTMWLDGPHGLLSSKQVAK